MVQNGAGSGVGRAVIQLAAARGVRTVNILRDLPFGEGRIGHGTPEARTRTLVLDVYAPADLDPSISRALGLPEWTNHVAFDAPTLEDLAVRRDRWLAAGQACLEVDHGWCTSIYCLDPNHILVEWCTTTREFTEADAAEALALLTAEAPAPTMPKGITLHTPDGVSQPMPTA